MRVGDLVNWEVCASEAMMLGLGDCIPVPLEDLLGSERFKFHGLLCSLHTVDPFGRVAKVLFSGGELLDVYTKHLEVMDECRRSS